MVDIKITAEAKRWLAAAMYATELSNHNPLLPRYEELPLRLQAKWEDLAQQWLQAIIPLLATGQPSQALPVWPGLESK